MEWIIVNNSGKRLPHPFGSPKEKFERSPDHNPYVSPEELLSKKNPLRPSPGDMIEFYRGTYCHWGLYYKDGYVINVAAEDKETTIAKVLQEKLIDVANKVPDYNKCRVLNLDKCADSYLQLNSFHDVCNILLKRGVEKIISEAKSCIGSSVKYDFKRINCEYYVTKWRYGSGFTTQFGNYVAAATFGVTGIAGVFANAFSTKFTDGPYTPPRNS